MLKLYENYSLKQHNTFCIDVRARYFFEFTNYKELFSLLNNNKFSDIPKLILGAGSNILFIRDFDGIIIHPKIKGKKIIVENEQSVLIKAGAGESWDDFVEYSVSNNYQGIENLSLIPGTVGASPIQNIGAYGVEVKNVIENVEAVNLETQEIRIFSNKECKFGYRDSIFKNGHKNKYIITYVTFHLNRHTILKTSASSEIDKELEKSNKIDITNIRKAIINIRSRKLPDPKEIGNAGSFFKNPFINIKKADELKKLYPSIPFYSDKSKEKVPAAWLVEQCGWKGRRIGDAGIHKNHSLILINYGKATGNDILHLAKQIQQSVIRKFNIKLETEVNII